jgi:adhesin/invasin
VTYPFGTGLRRILRRRLPVALALAVVAVSLGGGALTSGASFTSASSADVVATAAPVSSDIMLFAECDGSAIAGTTLANGPSVQVTDGDDNPVAGLTVTFTLLSGGGSISSTTAVTDEGGIAGVDWKLGTALGKNTLKATCAGIPGAEVDFAATGIAGDPFTLVYVAGDGQSATVNTNVPAAPAVRVTDAGGRACNNVTVTFTVVSGGGAVGSASVKTDTAGIATTSWKLGTKAGVNALSVASAVPSGSPLTFTATGKAGAATKLLKNGGDSQTVHYGTPVTTPPSVLVTDAYDNPVGGVSVNFTVQTGGGTVTGSPATTDASGVAAAGSWILGPAAGANSLQAASAGLTAVTFNATGLAGSPTTISANSSTSLSATVGTAVGTPPSVRVTDSLNFPVSGVAVTFAVTGGGSIGTTTATTNASGVASVGSWTLGTTAGANAVTATSGGLGGSPVTFTATGLAGPATKYVVTSSNPTPPVASTVTVSAQLADTYGNPVATPNQLVAFTTTGGTLGTPNPALTGSSGAATITFTVGTTVNTTYTVTAKTGSQSGTTLLTTTPGAPARLVLGSGSGQTATVNTAVATPPRVTVYDAYNNLVPNATVTFTPAAGSGTVTGGTATSNASGVATVGSWVLGTIAGTDTLTASCAGCTPVAFTATGTAGAATKYVVASSSYGPVAGTAVTITAQLADQFGNAVKTANTRVRWTKTGTGGTFSASRTNTNANGIATVTFTTSGTAGRTYTIIGTSTNPSTRTGTSAPMTTVPGSATQMSLSAGNAQTATAGSAVATTPAVLVRDSRGNAVPNVAVTFAVTGGGGSVTTTAATTNAAGIATCGSWTLGKTAGANTLTATRTGLTGSPVTFTATGRVGPAAKYVVTASSYTPLAGSAVAISAQLADQYGNAVATTGVAVTFTKTGTGGTLGTPNPATTSGSGIATITFTTGVPAVLTSTVTATSTGPITGTSPTITTH